MKALLDNDLKMLCIYITHQNDFNTNPQEARTYIYTSCKRNGWSVYTHPPTPPPPATPNPSPTHVFLSEPHANPHQYHTGAISPVIIPRNVADALVSSLWMNSALAWLSQRRETVCKAIGFDSYQNRRNANSRPGHQLGLKLQCPNRLLIEWNCALRVQ